MSNPSDKPDQRRGGEDISGRSLGGFQLLRRLGHGAMADVYLAEQTSLKRRVAVKILKPHLADDPTYISRFRREAQSAAALVHASIVQVYEVGQCDGLNYIAQEYVEGRNLRQWMAAEGVGQLSQAVSIISQTAAALAKAAEYRIVHRDIKPENIMLTRSGEVKVADFGLARVVRSSDETELTQEGVTVGTPKYMSPEQIEGKPLDPRSDIYSLGVTCYQLLAGSPPFQSETALGLAVQHLKKEPEPLAEVCPDLPPELCRIVHKMLEKDPDERYQSGGEILAELHQLHVQRGDIAWPSNLHDWDDASSSSTPSPRGDATRRLQEMMNSPAEKPRGRYSLVSFTAAIAAAFLVGGTVAWLTAEPDPLAGAKAGGFEIPRQQTALGQWYLAGRLDSEAGWQSVIDYFPDKPYFTRSAEKKLAELYLCRGEYAKATVIFERFLASGEENASFRAYGLAGKCFVLAAEDKLEQSAEALEQLQPIINRLGNQRMRRMVEYAKKKINANADAS